MILTNSENEAHVASVLTKPDLQEPVVNCQNTMDEVSKEDLTEKEKNTVFSVETDNGHILQRFKQVQKLWLKSERLRLQIKKKLIAAKRKIKRLEARESKHNPLCLLFNKDQLRVLSGEYKKIPAWCNDTLVKAYKLKFVCGSTGYESLLNANFPLPSLRTLTRKLENLKFKYGLIDEGFEFLIVKINCFKNEIDKDCTLVLDEMSITPDDFNDSSTNTKIGNVTLPNHDDTQVATHGLVFMLAGLASRWKQVVAYYFTGNKVNEETFKSLVEHIIRKAEEIGLLVHNVTSDMGPSNQAMWRAFGIQVSYSHVTNKYKHPCNNSRVLYFYSDVPHALKNIKNCLVINETIMIPDNLVRKYALPGNIVRCDHLRDIDVDKDCHIKLAHKIQLEHLSRHNHFQKMRVNNAARIFHDQVSMALELLTDGNKNDQKLTTGL